MLNALKTVCEMLKLACVRYDAKQSAHTDELKKYKEEVMSLRKENATLEAEQVEAMRMITEMANYLDKH